MASMGNKHTASLVTAGLAAISIFMGPPALLGGEAAAPTAPDVARVVASLQARYNATESFKAAFQQEIESQALGQRLISSGMVYYRRPGRMRWEFVGPERQTVVADGKTLWIYQEPQRQVIKLPLDRAFRTTTPLSFLIGLGDISDDFRARIEPPRSGGEIVLNLRSRASDSDVGALELELAAGTYDIVGALVTDAAGGTTRWEFTELERNIALADDLFEFTVPERVDVVVPPS